MRVADFKYCIHWNFQICAYGPISSIIASPLLEGIEAIFNFKPVDFFF